MEQVIDKILEFLSNAAQSVVQLAGGAGDLFAIYIIGAIVFFVLVFMKHNFAHRKDPADALRLIIVPLIWPLVILYLILRIFR